MENRPDKKSPFTDDEVKLINDLLHGSAQYKGTKQNNPSKSVMTMVNDKNPIMAKGALKTEFKKVLKLFLAEWSSSETDKSRMEGLDREDSPFTKEMDKLGERLLKMKKWV